MRKNGIKANIKSKYKPQATKADTNEQAYPNLLEQRFDEKEKISEFMGLIEKYIEIQELDRAIVHELIEKIVVHQATKLVILGTPICRRRRKNKGERCHLPTTLPDQNEMRRK